MYFSKKKKKKKKKKNLETLSVGMSSSNSYECVFSIGFV